MSSGIGRGRAGRAARPVAPGGDEVERVVPGIERGRGRGVSMKEVTGKSSSPSSTSPNSGSPEPSSPTREKLEELRISPVKEEKPIENKLYGSEGQPVPAFVNYVKMNIPQGGGIFMYHVNFTPAIDSIKLRRQIMRTPKLQEVIGSTISFTGMNLYLPKHLGQKLVSVQTIHPNDTSIKLVVDIEYIKNPPESEMIPMYNTLLRKVMDTLKMVQINRKHYMPSGRIELPHLKLEVWPGFTTHIEKFDGGVLLVCDASHRMLRTNTALDLLKDVYRAGGNFKENAAKAIVGCVILTRYNNKSYRVDDIDFTSTPNSTFLKSDGTEISYKDYFKTAWNQEITDFKQPLLIHRPRPKRGQTEAPGIVCLIPELSSMTGMTDDIRSDFRAMRDIASHTRIKPQVRFDKFCTFLKNVEANPAAKKVLSDWGITIDPNPLKVTARVLPKESIEFGGGKMVAVNDKADWSREATGSRLFQTINIAKWVFIYTRRDSTKAVELVKMLQDVTKFMGFNFALPEMVEIDSDSNVAFVGALRQKVPRDSQLVMIMTPGATQREDRYSAIKKLACCELAVPSQVIRFATVNDQKKARSVCQKVALQMQCKVGGQPWIVKIPMKGCMFVGIDAYHDASRKGRSVIALVASIDQNASQWYSKTAFQSANEEIANTLQSALTSCLKKYKERNGALPGRIFVYRDGVGDGQVNVVRDFEVNQFLVAIHDLAVLDNLEKDPQLTVIIVQKRINTKIMVKVGQQLDNPAPGTVLDREVTRPIYYDFFLVAQHVNQGTVTPTHYIAVHDDNRMPPDRMQRLTYKMVHLYYNWAGNIRVPAPCQYAHKIAYLVGQNVKETPQESICDKLFFL